MSSAHIADWFDDDVALHSLMGVAEARVRDEIIRQGAVNEPLRPLYQRFHGFSVRIEILPEEGGRGA